MGIDDRDEGYRSHGQAPRRRGPYESSDASAGRSYARGGRPRSYDGYDDAPSQRGGRRDYGRDDDPRSGGRYDRNGSSGRRPRDDRSDDMRRERRSGDPYARGERSGRSPRPPMREEWDSAGRLRASPRGPAQGDSGGRGRRPGAAVASARGGIWGDGAAQGANGLRRDPRALRRGQAQVEEEEESSPAAAAGKALLAIIMALLIGAALAYGYYVYSTPKVPANINQPSSTPSSGAVRSAIALRAGQPPHALDHGMQGAARAYLLVAGPAHA